MDNQINKIRIEVEQWLTEFNNAISLNLSKKDAFDSLSSLFIRDSHWRDLLSLTWKIQTFSGKENIIENMYRCILDVKAKKFSIDSTRTQPRKVTRADKTAIEVILSFETIHGNCEGIVRLVKENKLPQKLKAWNFLTALNELHVKAVSYTHLRAHET